MHVLYLHQYFVPPDGSGGTRSYEMARRLVRAGHRVTMVTSSADFPSHYGLSKARTVLAIDGIDVRVIRVPYSNKLSFPRRLIAFASFALRALLESARVRDVDVVFATSTPLTIAIPGLWAKAIHRVPMVFEVRDLWPELPVAIGALRNPVAIAAARWLEKTAYRGAAHVVALSPGMKEGIVRSGISADRVTVVPNSCDVELFRAPASAGESFLRAHPYLKGSGLVSYTGTLGLINGVEYMVDIAAAMLALDPSVRFVVTGDGRQRDLVLERARSAGVLARNLWLLPPIPKKDVPGLLSASTLPASLFIDLPEMWHNSANKFFDALAAGRPIMINYGGWQANLLRSTGAGLVVPSGDPAAAAALIRDFLSDEARLRRAREAAVTLADGEFSRDRLFQKLQAVLEGAAG